MEIVSIAIVALLVIYFAVVCVGGFIMFQKNIVRPKRIEDPDESTLTEDKKSLIAESKKQAEWMKSQKTRSVTIQSVDGLKLSGTLLKAEQSTGKIVLCSHGYHGTGIFDFGIFAPFYRKLGYDLLFIDQRCCGDSEGRFIGFGFWERRDIKEWMKFLVAEYGEDCKILLHGWSLGAASAMMAVEIGLPQQVKALIFDCGYTSAMDEFAHVGANDMKIPHFLASPIISMASSFCKIQAGYPFREADALRDISQVTLPVLFVHGKQDKFVPTWMGEKLYAACPSEKKELLLTERAAHCLSYITDRDAYEAAILRLLQRSGLEEG